MPDSKTQETILLIQQSGLFDEKFYRSKYPNVTKTGEELILHFCESGVLKGESPHPLFDTKFYSKNNPSVEQVGVNPFRHFLLYGIKEGRSPHPLFDIKFYFANSRDVEQSGINPLLHFLNHGAKEGRSPHPLFDTRFYCARNPEVEQYGINPLVHYVLVGNKEGCSPHPLFDNQFYLENNPDVKESGITALEHFLLYGAKEGKSPHPLFDVKFYLKNNPQIKQNPLVDYVLSGAKALKWPNPDFDPDHYARKIAPETTDNALIHYVTIGQFKHLSTIPKQHTNQLSQLCQIGEILLKQERFSEIYDLVKEFYFTLEPNFHEKGLQLAGHSPELDQLLLKTGQHFFAKFANNSPAKNISAEKNDYVFIATKPNKTDKQSAILEDFLRAIKPSDATILITDIQDNCDREAILERFQNYNAPIKFAPKGSSNVERLLWLFQQIKNISPEKIIYLTHQFDWIAVSSALSELEAKIYFYHTTSHAFALGITLPHTVHIDFHKIGWWNCRQNYGISNNVLLPLCASELELLQSRRTDFKCKNTLTTCSSANALQISLPYTYSFDKIIPLILETTKGEHIHWGEIPPYVLMNLEANLEKRNIPTSRFINVPWVKSIGKAMLDAKADIYLNSFPRGSNKSVVESMAIGMPLLMNSSYSSPFYDCLDLVYPDSFIWHTPEDLVQTLKSLTREDLERHSNLSFEHYQKEYTLKSMQNHLANLQEPAEGKAVNSLITSKFTHATNPLLAFFDNHHINLPLLSAHLGAHATETDKSTKLAV